MLPQVTDWSWLSGVYMVKYSRDMPELSGKKFLSSVLMLSMDIEAWENSEM